MFSCLIGLVFVFGPVISAVVKEASVCSYSCNNGACVGSNRLCDGRVDCDDASDEEGCQTKEIPLLITFGVKRLNPFNSRSTCRKNQWQCGDGTCITFDRICNRLLDCPDGSDEVPTLCQPTQPKSSVIFVSSDGQPAESTLPVSLSQPLPELSELPAPELPVQPVPEEYGKTPILQTSPNPDGFPEADLVLLDATGRPAYCKLPPNPTIIYLCLDSTTGRKRICKTFEPHNTLVQPQCAPYYIPFEGIERTNALPRRQCLGGIAESVYCTPDCGVVSREGTAMVEEVPQFQGKGFPWHAVIYSKKTKPYKRICAGSLVGARFIISAARCFWSAKDMKPLPASDFEVTMGNLYLSGRMRMQEPVQTSSVSKIHIPPRFRGKDGNFQDDIAVLFVTTPFTFSITVRPVCVEFDIKSDRKQLRDGNIGKVAGWWQVGNNNSLVQIRSLPYVGIEKCIAQSKPSFRSFLTSDKICAGQQPVSAFCKEDIGAGLAFAANDSYNAERYYLRGVLSLNVEDGGCNPEEYATFTQLNKHKSIGETIWDALNSETYNEDRNEPSPQIGKCSLPPYPEHGTYVTQSVTLNNVSDEEDLYELVELTVTCHQGYGIQGPASIKCFNGFWPDKVPKCIQMCALPSHPSVEYRCVLAGAAVGSRACRAHEPAGALVSPRCREPHYYSVAPLPFMRCNADASWSYLATCKPDCGRATPKGQVVLAIGGWNAKHGELPWHAGIYDKIFRPYKQICAGSLISNHLIISAAHCFWKGTGPLPPSRFAAAVGKLYRPWGDPKDDAQKSDVKHIHIPPRFRGSDANFQDDIAIIVVNTFQYRSYVRPVCLSFDANFEKKQLQTINKGKVAGWGLTSTNGSSAPVLQVLELPYVEVDTCIAKSPPTFVQYITSDKICAGTRNPNTALCHGDSGGGLVFSTTENYLERFYLRGVVSTAPADDGGRACNDAVYTCFTRVLQHEDFIKPLLTDF